MGTGLESIQEKIQLFRKRYYLNLFVKGFILTLTILLLYFLLAAVLEYALWLGSVGRFTILLCFFLITAYCFIKFLKNPVSFWIARKGIGDEQTARIIGQHIPDLKDKLVNLIQLSAAQKQSALAYASIEQKSQEFQPLQFESVVNVSENKRYLRFLFVPLTFILALMIFNESVLTQSTTRIVHFNQQFSPQAPFKFIINSPALVGFFNEDFTLEISLAGDAIPKTAYLTMGSQRLKMETISQGSFRYVFEKLQEDKVFQIEAAGFYSATYEIKLVRRPEVTQFKVELEYPKYLNRKNEKVLNAGNLEIPEGTVVNWVLRTAHANQASIMFISGSSVQMQVIDNQGFTLRKAFQEPNQYEITLSNDDSKNKERIAYQIDVIKDQYPQLYVNNFKDSILYKRIILGGTVADDYGVTQLSLEFHVKDERNKLLATRRVPIPVSSGQLQQSYFFNWNLDSLKLKPGEQVEYFLQVWDNDGVNGRKSTRSAIYTFFVPSKDELVTDIARSQSNTQQKIEEGVGKAQELQNKIEDTYQKLKGKQSLDWQDKKKLEDILEEKKNLDRFINELKEQNKLLDEKKNAFTEQDQRIREKAEQIQKLMNELLDEETRKLLAELEKLLKENTNTNQLQNLLDKLNQNSKNLEKELERTLELFKQLQFEFKIDQSIHDLKDQIDKQQQLLEKTEALESEQTSSKKNRKNNKGKNDSKGEKKEGASGEETSDEAEKLAEEQKELNQEFDKANERLNELREIGKELKKEDQLPGEDEMQQIDQSQQESEENLRENSPSQSKGQQQKAIQQMKQAQKKLESMQGSMDMEMDMQNIETLRQILHGLIKLSFDQESLIKNFSELAQNDPRFNTLAQQQLKLKDDAKVLEDSLLALGKRDEMMGSFITREVTELNNHLDKVIEANKERRRQQASSEMQFTMTSINNLALMLDSHFDMLMQMMANARPSSGKGKKKGQPQSLSQMQQQLNERIEQLKNGGKSGRQLSEELAEMAAEQERIRRALQEMQDKLKQQGGQTPGDDLPGKMEQTETELVNKQLTDQLIRRQREIMTRLLEAEKSMREQNLDEERKGETAKDYEKEIPKAVEEYLRLKEKEVELLKTVPPKLYPFYKKEVSEYFKRIGDN
jgi:hypothetical protein